MLKNLSQNEEAAFARLNSGMLPQKQNTAQLFTRAPSIQAPNPAMHLKREQHDAAQQNLNSTCPSFRLNSRCRTCSQRRFRVWTSCGLAAEAAEDTSEDAKAVTTHRRLSSCVVPDCRHSWFFSRDANSAKQGCPTNVASRVSIQITCNPPSLRRPAHKQR